MAVVVSESATIAGKSNVFIILVVFLVHRTESACAWVGRHITIQLGSWFRWDGFQPSMKKSSFATDLAAVMFFFLACVVTLAYVENPGAE